MRTALPIHAYALASHRELPVPESRRRPLPAAGFRARRGRLPGLAFELARAALEGGDVGEDGGVLLGTALGCLTETAAFVENMIEGQGVAPKPRAFTASVHNAMASEVSRKLGARGECQTFVGGENAHVQALFAADAGRRESPSAARLVGGLDEWTDYVARGRAGCGGAQAPAEGGGLLRLDGQGSDAKPLASLSGLELARPRRARVWLERALEGAQVDFVLGTRAAAELGGDEIVDVTELVGDFSSAGAVALCLAVGLLAGETRPEALGLPCRPGRLAILSCSRVGELGLVFVEAAG